MLILVRTRDSRMMTDPVYGDCPSAWYTRLVCVFLIFVSSHWTYWETFVTVELHLVELLHVASGSS